MRKSETTQAMSAVLYLTSSVLENWKSKAAKDDKDQKGDSWLQHAAWLNAAGISWLHNPRISAADMMRWQIEKECFKQDVEKELTQPKPQPAPRTPSVSVSAPRSNPYLLVNQPRNQPPHSWGNKPITQEEHDYLKFSY